MSREDRKAANRLREQLRERTDAPEEPNHVVYDFTGLDRPNVADLAMILTARLESAPGDSVWVRSLPEQTERILKILRLDHLFRHYPEPQDEPN